jgi:uncharacterized protein
LAPRLASTFSAKTTFPRTALPPLTIALLPEPLSICRLAPEAAVPVWALAAPFCTVTRTRAELSVICASRRVPAAGLADGLVSHGWRALMLVGPFDLADVGVLLRVAAPLAAAGVSVVPVATYDSDYVLVRAPQLATALDALRAVGHVVQPEEGRSSDSTAA